MTSPLTTFSFLTCKTNRFHVAMGLYLVRSEKMCQNIDRTSMIHLAGSSVQFD